MVTSAPLPRETESCACLKELHKQHVKTRAVAMMESRHQAVTMATMRVMIQNQELNSQIQNCCAFYNIFLFYSSYRTTVLGFKRRKGYCSGDDISTGSVMTLSQCSNTCLRNSSLVAFLYDFGTNFCKLLTGMCKGTTIDNSTNPNLYMYDQCK